MGAKSTSIENLSQLVAAANSGRICVQAPAWADTDQVLLDTAHQLHERGRAVVVACATEAGAERLRSADKRWPGTQKGQTGVEGRLRITTVRALALEALADARVQEQVKRANRVLDANEMDILVEDVKVSGLKPRRLREMLKFFHRSISDGTAEQQGWLVSQEEALVYAVLEENLEARRACMPCELAAKAWQGMTAAGIVSEGRAVVAEDYGAMSATSQRFLRYISNGELAVFGSDQLFATDAEPYPNPEGLAEYAREEGVESFKLELSHSLQCEQVHSTTPIDEFELVAKKVAGFLSQGIAADEILVAVPNSTWARSIRKALDRCAIESWIDAGDLKVKGSPREPDRCGAIKLAAFAKLLRNPDDFTALRTFVGAGDWLCASDGFLELLAYARKRGVAASKAMEMMRGPEGALEATASFKKMVKPLDERDELFALWETGTAGQVRCAMSALGMPLGNAGLLLGEDDAPADTVAFLDGFFKEGTAKPVDGVAIAPYVRCHGHRVRALVLTGMIDGFLPRRDAVDDAFTIDHRKQAIERDRAELEGLLACASQHVVYTRFERDVLENAAALHMVTTRIYHSHGRRMARVAPSTLLA